MRCWCEQVTAVRTEVSHVALANAINAPSSGAAAIRAAHVRADHLGTRTSSDHTRRICYSRGGIQRTEGQVSSRGTGSTSSIRTHVEHVRAWTASARRCVAVHIVSAFDNHSAKKHTGVLDICESVRQTCTRASARIANLRVLCTRRSRLAVFFYGRVCNLRTARSPEAARILRSAVTLFHIAIHALRNVHGMLCSAKPRLLRGVGIRAVIWIHLRHEVASCLVSEWQEIRLGVVWRVPPAVLHQSHGDFGKRCTRQPPRARHHLAFHPIHLPVRSRGSITAAVLHQHFHKRAAVKVLACFDNHIRRLDCCWRSARDFGDIRNRVDPLVRAQLTKVLEERDGEEHRVHQLVNAQVKLMLKLAGVHPFGAPIHVSCNRPSRRHVERAVAGVRERFVAARALLSGDVNDHVRVWNATASLVSRALLVRAELIGAEVLGAVLCNDATRANIPDTGARCVRRPVHVAQPRQEETR